MDILNTPFDWQAALCLLLVTVGIVLGLAQAFRREVVIESWEPPEAEVITEPRTHRNPLVVRMHERWQAAEESGDRETRLRQEIRMLRAGIEPPVSLEECTAAIKTMKGEPA